MGFFDQGFLPGVNEKAMLASLLPGGGILGAAEIMRGKAQQPEKGLPWGGGKGQWQAPKTTYKSTPSKNTGQSTRGGAVNSAVNSSGGVNYYTGGGSGYQAPAYDPKVIAQYDQSIGIINDALGRLGSQLNIAKGNVNRNYNTEVNELNSAKSQNQNNYKTSSTQNQQNLRTNRNAILDQQSAGLRGLQRQLGAYGAVGSDLQLAGNAVADVASTQNSGAGQTFAQNQQGLDTNWNNYLSEWANSKKRVDDWKTNQIKSAEQQSLSSRQDLLTQLADIRGQKAAAMGGDYAGGASGDLSRARGLSSRIDGLGKINPTYNGKTPLYTAPELDSYAAPEAIAGSIDPSNNATANSSLALLLGLDPEEQLRNL